MVREDDWQKLRSELPWIVFKKIVTHEKGGVTLILTSLCFDDCFYRRTNSNLQSNPAYYEYQFYEMHYSNFVDPANFKKVRNW